MLGVKPLWVLSPPHKISASNNHKVVVQDSLVESLKKRKDMNQQTTPKYGWIKTSNTCVQISFKKREGKWYFQHHYIICWQQTCQRDDTKGQYSDIKGHSPAQMATDVTWSNLCCCEMGPFTNGIFHDWHSFHDFEAIGLVNLSRQQIELLLHCLN